jgi:hypothetical protein
VAVVGNSTRANRRALRSSPIALMVKYFVILCLFRPKGMAFLDFEQENDKKSAVSVGIG